MNRETQAHFAKYPSVSIGRSKFDRSFDHMTSFSQGQLVPIFVDPDIVPGDTVSMKMAELVRMTTPLTPVMGNAKLDVYFFFVPNRLVMDEWKKLMGENETTPWTQTTEVTIPQIKFQNTFKNSNTNKLTATVLKGSVLDKMGIPPQNWEYSDPNNTATVKEIKVSALPPRAYALIWNEFFRDENLQNPVTVTRNSTDRAIDNANRAGYITNPESYQVQYADKGGLPPLKVCKTHDYFTSCLPGAQKGPAVSIPLTEDRAPVRLGKYYDSTDGEFKTDSNYGTFPLTSSDSGYLDRTESFEDDSPTSTNESYSLWTDLEHVTGATITQLRQAFAIQKFYERDARGGTRYIESIWSHFGVRNPDYRLQRPEYLGGYTHQINVNQVVQNSSTDEASPLGYTGAYSVTSNTNGSVFTKSFTEHGILMGLACIRLNQHQYSQGINRAWFKKKRLDFYSPEFANLSEMAVLNREIYAQGTSADEEAFGYQEAWAEMRYMPDMCTGLMRPSTTETSLGNIWTWGDLYTEKPTLGNKWIQEGKENIERTLALEEEDQFIADFYFGAVYTRPMPLYSIPGLIDHH